MDPWGMIKAGRYEEAVDAYTTALRESESSPNYCNRGIAHLNLGSLDRALLDFEAAKKCRPANVAPGDGCGQWIGTTHWLAGAERKAAEVWLELVDGLESNEIGYTDAAGGIESGALLWFAATWLQDANLLARSRRWLTQLSRAPRKGWPGPIGQLLLGRIAAAELPSLTSGVPILHERQLCQAYFFEAVAGYTMLNTRARTLAMERAASLSEAKLEQEWYLAKHELARLRHDGGA
jgi:tetratricopeptide (TPR) repeat protein